MNGLARWKIEHPEFMRTLKNNDLICITETRMNENDCKLITTKFESRFNVHFSCKKDRKAKRESGGIIVLVKTDFGKNITLTQNKDENIMWFKLSCDISDIHICCIYISPRSPCRYIRDAIIKLQILHNDITMYNCMGHIIVMGDTNCRTGTDNDYIEQESSQCDVGVIPYTIDDAIVASDVSILKHRRSEDKIVNENGKELLNLCVCNNLCTVNGRIGEYPDGSFTCQTARGESVVDYFIVKTEQLRNVANFKVQANNPLSDHNCNRP